MPDNKDELRLSHNITVASSRSFFAMFLVVVPVLVPYWRSLGLSMHEVLELQALFGLAIVMLEVPTGYVADLFGRKISVVIGSFISGAAFTSLPYAKSYNSLLLFEVLLALGGALVSGAEDALVYESIPREADRKKILGSFRVWSLLGESVASVLAGVLVVLSFEAVVWAQVVAGWIPFVCAIFFVEPPRPQMSKSSHTGRILEVIGHVFVKDSLTRLVFINYVVWGLSSFCVVWLLQLYWSESGVPVSYFGIIWAALMFLTALVSKVAHAIEHVIGAHNTLILNAAMPIVGYLLMAFAHPAVGIVGCALFYVTRGMTYVIFQDAFNWLIPSTYRATANSLQSLFFRLGFVPIGPLLGSVIDTRGLATALTYLAIGFIICAVLVLRPLLSRLGELHIREIPEQ